MSMPQGIRDHLDGIGQSLETNLDHREAGVWNFQDTAFEQTLPDGLTMDTVKQVYEHTNDVIASATWTFGTHAEKELQENGQLDSATARLPIPGCGEVTIGYNRSMDMPGENGETETHYGETQVKLTTIGQGDAHEDLKTFRQELARRAENLFSND
jgi:hypothetical protein